LPAPLITSASASSSGRSRVHSSNPCSTSSAVSGWGLSNERRSSARRRRSISRRTASATNLLRFLSRRSMSLELGEPGRQVQQASQRRWRPAHLSSLFGISDFAGVSPPLNALLTPRSGLPFVWPEEPNHSYPDLSFPPVNVIAVVCLPDPSVLSATQPSPCACSRVACAAVANSGEWRSLVPERPHSS